MLTRRVDLHVIVDMGAVPRFPPNSGSSRVKHKDFSGPHWNDRHR